MKGAAKFVSNCQRRCLNLMADGGILKARVRRRTRYPEAKELPAARFLCVTDCV